MKSWGIMKQNCSISIGWQGVILALAVVLYGLFEPAYCQDTVLLLQQTDPHGGAVTPDVGVHHFDLDSEVLLTAVPKPGYYFVYWIGDVSDPTADRTIVYLDAPKIVMAVFARSEFAFSLEEAMMPGGGGGGGTHPSAADYSNQVYTGGVTASQAKFKSPKRPELEQPERPVRPIPPETLDDFPIPGDESDDFPVPNLPEPATAMLLGLGSLLLARRKARN